MDCSDLGMTQICFTETSPNEIVNRCEILPSAFRDFKHSFSFAHEFFILMGSSVTITWSASRSMVDPQKSSRAIYNLTEASDLHQSQQNNASKILLQ